MSDVNKLDIINKLAYMEKINKRLMENELKSIGLFSGQLRILMYLADRMDNRPSQKEIAETFDISPAAVAVSLRKLEEAGYISKAVFDKDNRVNNISLTEKGIEHTDKMKSALGTIAEKLLEAFSENELESFNDGLCKVQSAILNYNN